MPSARRCKSEGRGFEFWCRQHFRHEISVEDCLHPLVFEVLHYIRHELNEVIICLVSIIRQMYPKPNKYFF